MEFFNIKNTDVLIPDFYLSGNNVSDVLQDKSGHLWVSTLDKGVRFVPDLNTKFLYKLLTNCNSDL